MRAEVKDDSGSLAASQLDLEALAKLVADKLPVRIAYIDRDYIYRFINAEYEVYFDIPPGGAIGRTVAEVAGEAAFAIAKPQLDKTFLGEETTAEVDVDFGRGYRRVMVTCRPDFADDGAVRGAVVHSVDITDRVRVENALRISEERYRKLFESIDEGFCILEVIFDEADKPIDYRFIEINPAFERFTGLKAADALGGKTVRELIPNLEDKWIEIYGQVALTGQSIAFEEGSEAMGRWFEVNASRIGEPQDCRVALLFTETTEKKAIERERERLLEDLRLERQRLTEVFEQAPAFLALLTGPDFTFQHANEAYTRLVGRPVVGKKLIDALPELKSQGFIELLQSVVDTGQPYVGNGVSVMITSEPGAPAKEHILDFVYQPVADASGKVYGVLAHGVDVTEQQRARQEIVASEERFRAVFEQAPDDAILLTDFDRRVQAWNGAAERITGWTAGETIGQSADLIFTPEDRAAGVPDEESARAVQDGKAIDERWHVRKDGSRFWGSGTMNALHDNSGGVLGFLKIFRDTTERHDQVRTLSFLRELTDAVAGINDADSIISTMQRMLGEFLQVRRIAFGEFDSDEDHFNVRFDWADNLPSVVGAHRLSDYGEQIHNNLLAGRMEVLRNRKTQIEETPEEAASLIPQVQSAITVPVRKENKLIAIFVVHHTEPRDWREAELTTVQQVADRLSSEIERARAETALRTSEERLRQLVELSPSTVWFGEPTGELSYISQDFYDLTGLTPEYALPNGWLEAVHPEDAAKVQHAWELALNNETPYDTEMRIRHRDGEYRWISARALPIRDTEGKVAGWLGSNSDIQDQKEIEETLRARVEERTQELQQAVREAEGFNYSISHDLRAPVRAIVSTASILLDEAAGELADEHRDLLKRQVHNANRLGVLIDELLRLSRLARVEVKRLPLDMTAKARLIASEMETSCRIEVQERMTAEGDPGLVRTIYQNLLENACKFSNDRAQIEVGQTGDTFWVKDYGVGFDMKYMSKIFQPFERLVSDAQFPGTGIGLANVERIVRRHGGRVWAESEPGKGATFFFTLG